MVSFLLFSISFVLSFSFLFLPKLNTWIYHIRDGIYTSIENANFTFINIKDNGLDSDIKPQIYVFVFEETENKFGAFVLDQYNLLNPNYWERENKEYVYGISFKEENFTVVFNNKNITLVNSLFFSDGNYEKEDILDFVNEYSFTFFQKTILVITFFIISSLIYLSPIGIFLLLKRFCRIQFFKLNLNLLLILYTAVSILFFIYIYFPLK